MCSIVSDKYKFIISGGGTGGHIFPAIAIANALKKRFPQAEFLFVGAKGKMEMEKIPAAGYAIEGLWISGLQRKLSIKNLLFPIKVISSLMKAHRIIKRFKPDVAIGVGGFASGPLMYAATGKKIPSLIQEQNSYAGITNKWVAKRVDKICVAYQAMERYFPKDKIVLTGNPVRDEIVQTDGKKEMAQSFFGLDPNKRTVVIIGGSLGAKSLNEAMLTHMHDLKNQNIQVVWQTGKTYYEQAKESVEAQELYYVKVYDFITKMDYAYAVADIMVSRAGALAIAELCLTAKATILIPFPFAAEDHQTKNAMALVYEDAAEIIQDKEAVHKLMPAITQLINNPERIQQLEQNILKLALPNAAQKIVTEIETLLTQKNRNTNKE